MSEPEKKLRSMAEAEQIGKTWWREDSEAEPRPGAPLPGASHLRLVPRPDELAASDDATPTEGVCQECNGAGWYLKPVPYGHPDFSIPQPCHCKQAEQDERERQELLIASNLEAFKDKTFASFNAALPKIGNAYKVVRQFAKAPKGFLALFGNCGVGKTHLAAAIANEAIARREKVYFAIAPDLLDLLRSGFDDTSNVSYEQLFRQLREVPLLIIDDLGVESPTAWAREKLYQLINYRYNYKLATVVTSNREFSDIDPRIASRLDDRALCPDGVLILNGADYRKTPR